MFVDPAKSVQRQYVSMQMTLTGLDEKTRASSVVADMRTSIRKGVGRMHALLLAADRKQDAEQVAQAMLGSDFSIEARRELISSCFELGVPCDAIPGWIDEIRTMGGKTSDLEALMNKAADTKQTRDGH